MQWKSRSFKSIHEAINYYSDQRADEFLNPPDVKYPVQNIDVLANWIQQYIKMDAPFYIVGDYDVDGINASAEMYLLLSYLGANQIKIRLPKRMSEGYGLSEKIIDEISSGVLITVDNGIAAVEAIKKAKAKGLVVLIIDHHMPIMQNGQLLLPAADLIVNPKVDERFICRGKLEKVVFRDYCGAGLVYKLAECMIPETNTFLQITALAAIATIADVMPLIKDNRMIFKRGSAAIQKGIITPGLQCLIDTLHSKNLISENDIGFRIAPVINAPGRIYDDGAQKSLYTLLSRSYSQAKTMVEQIRYDNEVRKDLKEMGIARAEKEIEERALYKRNPIIIFDPNTPEGIVGLIAGHICEKYNVSAFVFTEKDGYYKGSARGRATDDIKKNLDRVNDIAPDIFKSYGGHAGAAGISIWKNKAQEFETQIRRVMDPGTKKEDILWYDLEINATEVQEYATILQQYSPFGCGNPELTFCIRNFVPMPYENRFYTEMKKSTIKFSTAICDAIGFSLLERYVQEGKPAKLDLIGKISFHYYNGIARAQIEILDMKASQNNSAKQNTVNQSITKCFSDYFDTK